ncbi:carbon monoxide dehydrogenase subunit G [Vulcanisaeta moutnovskia 768-28]|uniref:Carbon monoxide dehydrogenase subunit G n=1 Tax=Vulcanisaeta moutnovskia (strain 768-28) TaxID=985053 RepID=F0QSH9_VULM7|nr:SRPBCC domain-containing protein [Vulcanisaeta moutnovskia]ADY00330.1 carbon monoxide dehydrogenase subunit G [Vulcanisaeta moutnovskia 768-28]
MSSELHYSGSFTVSKSPNEVLNFITDLPRAITCIPNIINYEVLSKDRVKARFRVDLGNEVPIAELRRITTDATIELINQSGNEVRYRVDGRAAGSAISILLTIRISGSGNDSRIDWDATASLGRLLQMMSRFVNIDSLVKRISEDTIHGFIECLLR